VLRGLMSSMYLSSPTKYTTLTGTIKKLRKLTSPTRQIPSFDCYFTDNVVFLVVVVDKWLNIASSCWSCFSSFQSLYGP
jgi:hypothetical protein